MRWRDRSIFALMYVDCLNCSFRLRKSQCVSRGNSCGKLEFFRTEIETADT